MKLSRNLMHDIRVLADEKADAITPFELFSSPEYRQYLVDTIAGMTARFGAQEPKLHLFYDDTDEAIGGTSGDVILANSANPLSRRYSDLLNKFISNLGVIFHEIGHVLFCDFDTSQKMLEHVRSGHMPGDLPVVSSAEDQATLDDLVDTMSKPEYAGLFFTLYKDVENALIDIHDEAKMKQAFGPLITSGLTLLRHSLRDTCESLEDMEASGKDKLSIVFNLLLQFASFGTFHSADPVAALQTSEYAAVIRKCANDIEAGIYTDNVYERFTHINSIVLAMWPVIKDTLRDLQNQQNQQKNQQNQSGQSQQGSGAPQQGGQQQGQQGNQSQSGASQSSDPNGSQQQNGQPQQGNGQSQQSNGQNQQGNAQSLQGNGQGQQTFDGATIQAVANALEKAVSGSGQTRAPKNCKSSKEAKEAGKKDGNLSNAKKNNSSSDTDNNAANDALNNLLTSVAAGMAENDVDAELNKKTKIRIRGVSQNSTHANVPLDATRAGDVSERDKEEYELIYAEVQEYSKKLQKEMKTVLKDMKDGSVQHHKLYGKTIDAGQTYRPDERYYSTKKLPQDLPDMAVAILVDCSGSMSGERIGAAKQAAILLHDFCTGLQIPVHVAGHNTYCDKVEYCVYADYDAVGSKDKYRIAQMETGGCNRDGMAIEIAANLLSKQPEEIKLLIIISDGQPNHMRYGGDSAKADMSSIVAKYRRKGVKTFAAAIGSDKEEIESIYKDGFIDISDLTMLPKTLVRLVKKYIV